MLPLFADRAARLLNEATLQDLRKPQRRGHACAMPEAQADAYVRGWSTAVGPHAPFSETHHSAPHSSLLRRASAWARSCLLATYAAASCGRDRWPSASSGSPRGRASLGPRTPTPRLDV